MPLETIRTLLTLTSVPIKLPSAVAIYPVARHSSLLENRRMKKVILFFVCFLPFSSIAADARLTFEPLYGIETALVRFPEPPRYVTRATYGLRLVYGTTPLSAEAEATRSQSRNDYPDLNQKVEDTSDRLSLGLRSTIPLASFLGFYLRAGGRASQGETTVTTNGVSEDIKNPLRVDPYAGAGFQLAFSSILAANAGVTLIRNAEGKYDSQYTLGLSARFGNR